jgi:hypothetical protein
VFLDERDNVVVPYNWRMKTTLTIAADNEFIIMDAVTGAVQAYICGIAQTITPIQCVACFHQHILYAESCLVIIVCEL